MIKERGDLAFGFNAIGCCGYGSILMVPAYLLVIALLAGATILVFLSAYGQWKRIMKK